MLWMCRRWDDGVGGWGVEGGGKEIVRRRRKPKARCFTAYLWLGHYEYRGDIKQIRPEMTRVVARTGLMVIH